jgi:peptidoglycan hydrolase CwlO-like protein
MKKKVILTVLALMIISLFLVIKFNSGTKTIEEAINKSGSKGIYLIHEEKTDKGSIVFYNQVGYDGLSTAFVKKV